MDVIVEVNDMNDVKPAIELCRLCANPDKQFIPIFLGEGIEHNIAEQINKYLPIISVTKTDELPLQICYQCASTLVAWHNFFEQCREADCRLREISTNVKFNEDDGSYLDYTEVVEEQIIVGERICDNIREEIVLPESMSSDSQVMETSDNDTININVDVSETVPENLNDNRLPVSRKWVPFATKRPASLSAKDERAEMWKPKKIRLDSATGIPISAATNLETAPKDDVIYTPVVLIPTASGPGKSKATKGKGQSMPLQAGSAVPLATPFCTSSPALKPQKATAESTNAQAKEAAVKLATKCAVSPSKTPLPKSSPKDPWAVKEEPKKNEEQQPMLINCDDCEFTAKTMLTMQRHYKLKHPEGLKDICFVCFHCCFISQHKSAIRRHILDVHMEDRRQKDTVTCGICWRDLSSKRVLRGHIQRYHNFDGNNSAKDTLETTTGRWNYGYCCDICGRGYENEYEMLAHRDIYHPDLPPMFWSDFLKNKGKIKSCTKCKSLYRVGQFFANHSCIDEEKEAEFEERMKEALRANPSYRCDICSFSSIWKVILRQHWQKTHSDASANTEPINWDELSPVNVHHYCIHCYKAFDEEAELAQHFCPEMEMEARPKLYVCNICDVSFPRKATYQRHSQIKHGIYTESDGKEANKPRAPIQCPYCEHIDSTRARTVAHIRQVHKIETDSPYMCVPCCKIFQRKALLDAHNQIYHPKDDDMSAENERILAKSQISLNGELTYHCSECSRNYEHPMRFLTHYRLHFVERKFVCHLCGKQTRTQNHLKTHIRNFHLDIRSYKCDICNKGFHSKLICEQHRRIHTGERPFACEVCGKTFPTNCALLSHKKFHDDFFPHECHLCPKKFKIKRCLTNHIRIHTGERPFRCELCFKTFSDPSRFSYHKKVTHSDERRVECKVCGNRYKANKYLTRHMKKEHPDA